MADFEPDFVSSYFLCREIVLSLFSLFCKVWLEFDCWLNAYLKRPGTTKKIEQNLAAKAFLKLLDKLRIVLRQAIKSIFIILL